MRHASGDWGDVCEEDRQENEFALENELRLFSVYHLRRRHQDLDHHRGRPKRDDDSAAVGILRTSAGRGPLWPVFATSTPKRTYAMKASPSLTMNTVITGDCIDILKTFPSESVDFVLTDPPYLASYRPRDGRTVTNDSNDAWLRPAFAEMFRVLRPDSFCVTFYGWPAADLFLSAFRNAGFRPVSHLSFVKPYSSFTGYTRAHHEVAYVLAKGSPHEAERTNFGCADLALHWKQASSRRRSQCPSLHHSSCPFRAQATSCLTHFAALARR